jgi:hypothetical protein
VPRAANEERGRKDDRYVFEEYKKLYPLLYNFTFSCVGIYIRSYLFFHYVCLFLFSSNRKP